MRRTLNKGSITRKISTRVAFGVALLLVPLADACQQGIATSTIYYVPHVRTLCGSNNICPAARSAARMQGSVSLGSGKILNYRGQERSIGNCDTALGASGSCLIPYISVAADPRHYRMGDIISMPQMRGKRIALPNGGTMSHPGYFIVHDTGGSIKGANRFDFFTGSHGPDDSANAFGRKGGRDTQMVDKNACGERKRFSKISRGTGDHRTAMAAIEGARRGQSSQSLRSSERPTPKPGGAQ